MRKAPLLVGLLFAALASAGDLTGLVAPPGGNAGGLTTTGAITATHCASWSSSTVLQDAGVCAGSPTFDAVGPGTNAGALVVGTGGSLTISGSGTINATSLGGATFAAPGAIGGGTPAAGAFTTLSASSTVSGAGFSTYLASPPAIGGSAAAAGSFTTLSASSTVSGTGFSTYLASPPAIGGSSAAAGSFTTLVGTTLNGNTFTTGTYTLTGVGGKTLTFNKTITLDGTDTTTMTFPATSQTIAGLSTAQTWGALQKFTNADLALLGSSTGYTLVESGLSSSSNNTLTLPVTATDTLAALGTVQTWTAAQTFTDADLLLKGSSSGAMTLKAPAAASTYVMTFPAVTDTVATLTATQTLTNTSMPGLLTAGTKFTVAATGCTPSATTGSATGGTITLASGPCTSLVITMAGATGLTAATGWKCSVGDRTAQTGGTYIPGWYENSSTTTTATIPIPAAAGATDVIAFSCIGF